MVRRAKPNSLRDRLEDVLEVDPSSCTANLCLASANSDGFAPTYHRLSITDKVASKFRAIASNVIREQKKNLADGNFSIRAYDAISKLDTHEVEYVDLSQYQDVRRQIDGLNDLSGLGTFVNRDGICDKLRFYVIVIESDHGDPVYFFRSCSPKMELQRSPKFAIVFAKGHYDTFSESLFVFDRGVDCFCRGRDLFVLNKGRFEVMFQFFEGIKQAASETLETIRKTIPIHNFEELETACLGHIQMLKKLKNIAAQPYLDRITMGDIKKVIKEMGLSLSVNVYSGQEKLTFDSKDKWEILRLLDDDYLKSVMTGEKYEVNSKRTM